MEMFLRVVCDVRGGMNSVFRRLHEVVSWVQANKRCVQRLIVTRSDNWEDGNRSTLRRMCLAFGVGFIGYTTLENKWKTLPALPVVSAATVSEDNLKGRREKFNFIADVVAVSSNAVVFIEIQDAKYVDMFTGKHITLSNGSGFIVKSDGLILTNAHVVNRPRSVVKVKLYDGTEHIGFVEHVDEKSDLATVRIPVINLPTMKLGSSASLRPGEWVVAIGSPIGLSNSVTAGVISSTQRSSKDLGLNKDITYIQTDAPITFGNSGGPLVNLDGEAIGINCMKVENAGISFAIPIDYVKEFLATSKTKPPKVAKKYLGITMVSLNPDILHELRMRHPEMPKDIENGIIVWKVIINSPAHSGGLQPGDIVTHMNGKKVHTPQDIYTILQESQDKIKVEIVRGSRRMTLVIYPEQYD